LTFNDIEGAHYDAWPLGHSKLDTTARYTQVATSIIREVGSPLDRLTPLVPNKKHEPPA
jgi:integrase/recombinase XerD